MRKRSIQEELDNIILPVIMVVILFVLCGILFDSFYELNDDTMIKDILSGAYAGKADGHTNQLLYPLSFLLSKMYVVFSKAPIFGVFLSACFAVSFVAVGYRSLSYYIDKRIKLAVIFLEGALFFCICMWELVYMQYSVVSGILAAAACFWFLNIPKGLNVKEFFKQGLPALAFVWLAFLVRSEMLLLMCPFLATVGMIHWLEETKMQILNSVGPGKKNFLTQMFDRHNIVRYMGFVLLMVLGLGGNILLDSLAYKTEEWKEFREFFDARTEVYDYTWYPDYEKVPEVYEEQGISKEQYQLIDSYNFGLDESLNAETLQKISDYNEKSNVLGSNTMRLKNLIWEIVHNMFAKDHAPYNYAVLFSYGLVIGLAWIQKRKDYIGKLALLAGMRTISWSYLIWSQRVVNRIAHPLYIIEFLILLAVLVKELYERPLWNIEKYYRRLVAFVYMVLIVSTLGLGYKKVNAEQQRREEILVNQNLLEQYCKERKENYYYLDVYSSVSFIEKVYKNVDNSRKNYDLLGGWICKSPLQKKARQEYIESNNMNREDAEKTQEINIEEAMLLDNFYFVIEKIADTAFLTDYYKSKEKEIILELQDEVGTGVNPFLIYKLREKEKK